MLFSSSIGLKKCSSVGISDLKAFFFHSVSFVLQAILLQMRSPCSRTAFSHSFWVFQTASFSAFSASVSCHCIPVRPEYGSSLVVTTAGMREVGKSCLSSKGLVQCTTQAG